MHPYAAEVAAETGADPAVFRSRAGCARNTWPAATLVLTATRRQRSVCTALAPGVLHRTFTLRQFGRLAAAAGAARAEPAERPLRAAVEAAARARGRLQPAAPDADDLRDPIGGTAGRLPALRRGDRTVDATPAALIGAAG